MSVYFLAAFLSKKDVALMVAALLAPNDSTLGLGSSTLSSGGSTVGSGGSTLGSGGSYLISILDSWGWGQIQKLFWDLLT